MDPCWIPKWVLWPVGMVVGLVGVFRVDWQEVFAQEGCSRPTTYQKAQGERGGTGKAPVSAASSTPAGVSGPGQQEQVSAAVRALAKALADPDAGVRESAVYALRSMGQAAKEAIPALGQAVRDQDGYVRALAGRTLARFGQAAVPTLAGLLKELRPEVRLVAAEALRTMGPEAKEAVEALGQALGDPSPAVRETAAHALRELGPAAQPALRALQSAVADRDGYVRSAAARALVRIGPAALPVLAELLRHRDERVRRLAAEIMHTIGAETTDAPLQ